LVTVTFQGGARASAAPIQTLLRQAGLNAAAEDNDAWNGRLDLRAGVAWAVAAAATPILLAAVAGLAVWAARLAIARRRPRIRLLLQLGAAEFTLLRPFRPGLFLGAGAAVVLGAAGAGAVAALAWSPQTALWLQDQGLGPPPLDSLDLVAALAWPLAAFGVVACAAEAAARTAMRRLS
jgi:cell division protein FtsX